MSRFHTSPVYDLKNNHTTHSQHKPTNKSATNHILMVKNGSLKVINQKIDRERVYVVPSTNVKEFIMSLFKTKEIINFAKKSGSLLESGIEKLSHAPLFVLKPNEDPANRLNFISWMRLLSLREDVYKKPILSDLYYLHELYHIAFTPYGLYPSHKDCAQKMFDMEQQASLFSETFIHFELPSIRKQIDIPSIWADSFISEKQKLSEDMNNKEFFNKNPKLFFQQLLDEFNIMDKSPLFILDEVERRSVMYNKVISCGVNSGRIKAMR